MVRIGGARCMRGNGLGRMTWHTRKNKLVRRERRKGGRGMVILEEDHCGCVLGAWLWAVGYSYPSVFSCFQLNWISAFNSQFLVSLSLQFKYLLFTHKDNY